MEEHGNSIESIVVLSDSLVTNDYSYRPVMNCINQNELNSSQSTLRNHLDDTGSSSFMAASQDPDYKQMEKQILNLSALLNAYKTENHELRMQLKKQARLDAFCDIDSASLIEKIEVNLTEANRIFTNPDKLKDSMEYLVKNLWSSIAYNYTDGKLASLTQTRDELLEKLEKNPEKGTSLDSKWSEQMQHINSNNLKIKDRLAKQNKILDNIAELFEKMRNVPEPIEELEEKTLTNEEIPEFYLYNANGYIAIDQDLSLNKELQVRSSECEKIDESKLFKCPKCLVTVQIDTISDEIYQNHMENCKGNPDVVCMFCLYLSNNTEQLINHIDVHIDQLGNK